MCLESLQTRGGTMTLIIYNERKRKNTNKKPETSLRRLFRFQSVPSSVLSVGTQVLKMVSVSTVSKLSWHVGASSLRLMFTFRNAHFQWSLVLGINCSAQNGNRAWLIARNRFPFLLFIRFAFHIGLLCENKQKLSTIQPSVFLHAPIIYLVTDWCDFWPFEPGQSAGSLSFLAKYWRKM